MKVPLQLLPTLWLLVTSSRTRLFVISIAIIPLSPMLWPRTHANPTEFILALFARHVIAPTILFDNRFAFRAFVGICRNPVWSLGIVCAFLEPFRSDGADSWFVICSTAAKAEGETALTEDWGYHPVECWFWDVTLYCIFTIWRRAPAEVG